MWLLFACTAPTPDTGSADTAPRRDSADTARTDTSDSGPVDTADSQETGGGDTGTDTTDTAPDIPSLKLTIPAYVWPEDPTYAAWVAGAAETGGAVVLNPASGPGETRLDAYVDAVAAARAAGIAVLGYVHTRYGERPAADVDAEVARWADFYGVDGIFFDEVASGCDRVAWYAERAAAADAVDGDGDAFVAFNPGVESCEAHLEAADLLVVAEDEGADLLGYTAPAWAAAYDPDRFWLLAHSADDATMSALLDVAREQGVGNVYVTDDALPNPWDGLPTYWDEEVAGGL
jgi:hypothetical protein